MIGPSSRRRLTLACALLLMLVAPVPLSSARRLVGGEWIEPTEGTRISIIGNTLAERMQHDGWLETLLQSRFPRRRLVVRNLGFSGDTLTVRLRSAGFGTPQEHLAANQTDIVVAMFGYNESFAGEEGLPKFRSDLAAFIRSTLAARYNGQGFPRLVIVSPIAHEDLDDPNLPDGSENNARLARYTAAMAEVTAANGGTFVDLFSATGRMYAEDERPLTINGVHLNEHGNRLVAEEIYRALFSADPPRDPRRLEPIRAAVKQKNFTWFHRYRTTDGYSIFGGRADLRFTDGQTNRVVMQREMEVLDAMTANRDEAIWAAAQGKPHRVDDSNAPPFLPVVTNKPGPLPGGKHQFLTGQESLAKMEVAEQLRVNLFASEEMFPELISPVQMAFDTRGRLWVATWPTYPHWKPQEAMNDRLLILEDTNGDGQADVCRTFVDQLHNPTGFEFYGGGVIVAMAPDLIYLKDTDGDDKADVRERILHGIDSADTHHTANSFVLGPDGGLYFQEGTFHHTQIESPYGPTLRSANSGVYRFEPRTRKVEQFVSYNFANPHGHVLDRWGRGFLHDGTGAVPYDTALISGNLDYPSKHAPAPTLYRQRTRPCSATEILSSRHFPPEMQGNLLVGNVIGFQGILQYQLAADGASFVGTEVDPLLFSRDANFRPVDFEIGPDGAIYFLDWQNPIIGHMQHNLRDPSRDRQHGRVYRITYAGRPLSKSPPIAGATYGELMRALESTEDRVRYRARLELTGRDTDKVLSAAEAWTAGLDPKGAEYEHHLLEALWLHQSHNRPNPTLLKRLLRSPNHRARAAATRVLGHWRDQVQQPLELLSAQAVDEHPRVRLEAVRACSYFRNGLAAEVALSSLKQPMDRYLDYVLAETIKQLEPYWKSALTQGEPLAADNQAGGEYLLARLSTAELVKLPRTRSVNLAMLSRPHLVAEQRHEALQELARLNKSDRNTELVAAIARLDQSERRDAREVLADLAHLLIGQPPAQDGHAAHAGHGGDNHLADVRPQLAALASKGKLPFTRQLALVALIGADGALDPTWQRAAGRLDSLEDLLAAVPLLADAKLRGAAHQRVKPLLHNLPAEFATADDAAGRVRRAAIEAIVTTGVDSAETFRTLAGFIRSGQERGASVRAISRIPANHWPRDQVAPLVAAILEFIGKLPADERTSPEARDALQLGNDLAALLPSKAATAARRSLRELGVPVIVIRPVPHRMMYDRPEIYVEAGKSVEIVLENVDIMPHNLLIVRPGAMEKVGVAGEKMASDPQAFAQGFVPDMPEVMHATALLQPADRDRIHLTAPTETGDYPFVCTFPGHWRRMNGVMHVVASLDDIPPEALLAGAPTSGAPVRPFVRNWTVADLTDLADALAATLNGQTPAHEQRPNLARGKELFAAISCLRCHRMNGQGGRVGPDLAEVRTKLREKKLRPIDLLVELVEPSKKIDDKFRTNVLELVNGRIISGVILEERDGELAIGTNPLDQPSATGTAEPIKIAAKDIAERFPSQVSIMPAGLLNTLSKEEIRDLLGYVVSGGDAEEHRHDP